MDHPQDDNERKKAEQKKAAEVRASWREYYAEIDRQLDGCRPDRSGKSESEWREEVYGWARNHIPDEQNIVRAFAKQIVDIREGVATKRGNKFLRQWRKGQRPLFWSDLGPLPIVVEKVRIRLDAATPDDVEDAALEVEAQGKAVYDEVLILGHTLLDLARDARRKGLPTVALLGDLNPRKPDDGGALQPYSDDDDDEAPDDDDEDF